jgi:predicted transcriptional regulator
MTYPNDPGFQAHSETSRIAADMVDDDSQLVDVLSCFHKVGWTGATGDEITVMMQSFPRWKGMENGTVSARMATLKNNGTIVRKGERRKTRKGRPAEVYVHKSFI